MSALSGICSVVNPLSAERELVGSVTDRHIVSDLPVRILKGNHRVGAADVAETAAYTDGGKIRERAVEVTPDTKLRWGLYSGKVGTPFTFLALFRFACSEFTIVFETR